MKILVINKFHYPRGGADRHVLDLVDLLEEQGHQVAVFSMHHPKNQPSRWSEYFVSQVGFSPENTLWQKIKGVLRMGYSCEAKQKISLLLDAFQPDVVHVHNLYHQISPSILPVIKKRGIPVVMTLHDYYLINPDYLHRAHSSGWFSFCRQRPIQGSCWKSVLTYLVWNLHQALGMYTRYIDHYISPSEYTKALFVKAGMDPRMISVIPHFIDDKETLPPWRAEDDEPYVLYCGRIAKDKGVDRLIDMFRSIHGVRLYLAGAVEPGFVLPSEPGNIKVLGFLRTNDLQHYLRQARAVVSPSRLPETFGLIALEAMKFGKPFIGFQTGAFSEIVDDGVTGYLCQNEQVFRQRILEVVHQEGLRNALGSAAALKMTGFGKTGYYARLRDIFLKQLSGIDKNYN